MGLILALCLSAASVSAEPAAEAMPELLSVPSVEESVAAPAPERAQPGGSAPAGPRSAAPPKTKAGAAPSAPAVGSGPGTARDYILGPHDIIEIQVFDEPELSKEGAINPEGRFGFPLLGSVPLGGLSVEAVEELLKRELSARFLVDPQVFVTVKEYNSRRAMVMGMVKEPSAYSLKGETTILDLLSRAGGMLDAGGKNLVLIRGANARGAAGAPPPEPIIIDAHRLLRLGEAKLNLTVDHGDILFVPKADGVYVYGEVRKPGVVAHRDGLTVLQAVSLAEGLTNRARPSRVQVIRVEQGQQVKFQVNLDQVVRDAGKDIRLLPEDVIVVPESFF
jgi:polysaccharide biosynthesis/export protein